MTNKRIKKQYKKFIKALKIPPIVSVGRRKNEGEPVTIAREVDFSEGFGLAIQMISEQCVKDSKKLMFIGNGGSAAIASHQAVDFLKNLGIKTLVFNDPALLTCMANDYGYENVFSKPISIAAEKGDVLVAISSSGKSSNILRAVEAAMQKEGRFITMSGFDKNNPLRTMGDINFYVSSLSYRIVEASHSLYLDFILEMLISQKKD